MAREDQVIIKNERAPSLILVTVVHVRQWVKTRQGTYEMYKKDSYLPTSVARDTGHNQANAGRSTSSGTVTGFGQNSNHLRWL